MGLSYAILHFWLGAIGSAFTAGPNLSLAGQNDTVGWPLTQILHSSALDMMGHSPAACAEYLRCVFKRNEWSCFFQVQPVKPRCVADPWLGASGSLQWEREKLHEVSACYLEAGVTKASV